MSKTYRMSLERHNAPFRGISSKEDSVNFDLALMHDFFHLEKISGGNPLFRGHTQQIKDNLAALYHGETNTTASIPTAGKLVTTIGKVPDKQDLSLWTPTNGTTVVKSNNKFILSSNGLLVESGIVTIVEANPGDVLLLRFKVKKLTGQGTKMAIGAKNFTPDGNELLVLDLSQFTTGQYIEKRLRCTSRKDIELVLYSVYETVSGAAASVSIEDFSLSLLRETNVGIIGTDSTMKIEMEMERRKLSFLEDRITSAQRGRDD